MAISMPGTITHAAWVRTIRRRAERLASVTEQTLHERGLSLRYAATAGKKLTQLIPQAFPLVIEAARRILGQVFYDEQIDGGIHLARGRIIEMKTGEGKTLTATLPAFLFGLTGRGSHIVTVNDYLAQRDRDTMGPIYETLGLTVGVIQTEHPPPQRRVAYQKDITYGTAKEIGFDFLRDRLAAVRAGRSANRKHADAVQRPFYFALVDEADSILIDEARTPLIIGMIDQAGEQQKQLCYAWSAEHAVRFKELEHYKYEHDKRQVKLNPLGWQLLRDLPQSDATRSINIRQLCEYMETAIKAARDYHLDKHYAIVDDKVVIIDEFTGRPAEGRQWQKGLHQAIESKEQVEVTPATHQAATITVQSLFKLYPKFAGMTGTAWTSRREFRKVYRRRVVRVPTHRPIRRTRLATKIFCDMPTKFRAVVDEVRQMISQERAVLIGTRSVDKSEMLSKLMSQEGIAHQVLNARHLPREADIVTAAGEPCRVTIATNMAGRGTDIKLHETVCRQGGLHVVLTEIHEAERIDWQLIGLRLPTRRPGQLPDLCLAGRRNLAARIGPQTGARRVAERYARNRQVSPDAWLWFKRAQRKLERRYFVDRMILMEHEKQTREQYFDTGQDPYLDVPQ